MAEPWRKLADEVEPAYGAAWSRRQVDDLARRVWEEGFRAGERAAQCQHCRAGEPFKSQPAGAVQRYHVVAVAGGHTYQPCEAERGRMPLEPPPTGEGGK